MATCYDYACYVAAKLDERDLLEQLAEEASEVSQAALKLIRAAKMSDNATPLSQKEAAKNLAEELIDFQISRELVFEKIHGVVAQSMNLYNSKYDEKKLKRWAERLEYEEG